MARTIKDTNLGTRTARTNLLARSRPYYRLILQGLSLGYYRGTRTGTWSARRFLGGCRYEEAKLGTADDVADADGHKILSFTQAQERARLWFTQRGMDDDGINPTASGPYTVSDALDDYAADYARRGGKDVSGTKNAIEAHIRPVLGSIDVKKLTRSKLETWQQSLISNPPRLRTKKGKPQRYRAVDNSPDGLRRRKATANKIMMTLKAALSLGFENRRIPSKDAWIAVKPFREADAPKIRYLTDVEMKNLIGKCQSPFRELVLAALLTGARYGELAAMSVGDFDEGNQSIHIARSKSGKPRHIHLTDEGVKLFKALTKDRSHEAILLERASGLRWGPSLQHRHMQDACKNAKIVPAIGFHILRHTYASRLAMNRVPLPVIADQLGHADSRMTEKHYAHLGQSYVAETIRQSFVPLGIEAAA
jgi:integrase